MAEEKVVVIPLRAGWVKKPIDDRTKRAIRDIKEYVFRHMKAEDVKVSRMVNEVIWSHGRQRPPGKLKVKVSVEKGIATVRLPDEKEEPKSGAKKGAAASLKDKLVGKQAKPAQNAEQKPAKEAPALEKKEAAPKAVA